MLLNNDKICLITGADSGIGKAAARGLAGQGLTLLLPVRNHVLGERTVKELISETGNENIYLFIVYLSSQKSIFELSEKIKEKYNQIDILINNAGAHYSKRHLTVDGIEATFAVNYLSRFLLTNLLLDLVKKSKQGRIINVSGEYHWKGKINFNDLNLAENYSAHKAIAQSKLADVLFTYSLAEKLKGTNVTVNCLHPGTVSTNIIYSDPDVNPLVKLLYRTFSPFFKSSEKGAETIQYLAASLDAADKTGKYFINKKAVNSSPDTYNMTLAQKLWEESEKLISDLKP